ncbi:membrane-spanning 4-domains subfamily A member 5 [Trichechus manatus latirostris]|uniref:Membrane-spanning 4-domains subfamily A member 5 n=1 Tax=Trichechus manatus latirostris TaxID=127582 RepID=A0A2Y9EA35_TRIMA|nr:membrane-spanning 4-domains subfamily A member 5 [Trichechus manatus latirostris]
MVLKFQDKAQQCQWSRKPWHKKRTWSRLKCQPNNFLLFQNINYTIMDTSNPHSPVFLAFPPEITIPRLQQMGLTATPFVPRNLLSKILDSKLKLFGAIQIVFGMMHFSSGMIILFTFVDPYPRFPFIFITGYPFWGSILFINSGAFLIAVKKKNTDTLMIVSRMMNSLSALGALAGIILFSFGLTLDQHYICGFSNQHSQCHAITTLLVGILIMLMIFTIIEFFIALSFSIFWGQ